MLEKFVVSAIIAVASTTGAWAAGPKICDYDKGDNTCRFVLTAKTDSGICTVMNDGSEIHIIDKQGERMVIEWSITSSDGKSYSFIRKQDGDGIEISDNVSSNKDFKKKTRVSDLKYTWKVKAGNVMWRRTTLSSSAVKRYHPYNLLVSFY